jgi:hypothetical protein
VFNIGAEVAFQCEDVIALSHFSFVLVNPVPLCFGTFFVFKFPKVHCEAVEIHLPRCLRLPVACGSRDA